MKQKKPINLELTSLTYPPMAIASILHRMSGIVLFLLFPVVLYALSLSLGSERTFQRLMSSLANPYGKLGIWLIGSAFIYHAVAGIRHIIMDIGFGEALTSARRSALIVIILSIILIFILGIWLW